VTERYILRDFGDPTFSALLIPVLYVQRANTVRGRIQGLEAAYEIGVSLGRMGSITPFGTMGWLKGSDLTPDRNALRPIQSFCNRADTPIPLRGSTSDAPLSSGATFGARYSDRQGVWSGQYEIRYQARVERVDPLHLATAISTQYDSFASRVEAAKIER